MADLKPIETFYNGYRFRSRLEARWAVFFDKAGIPYQYEPEGFDLGEFGYYLPDFYLPWFDAYVEIKPEGSNQLKEASEKLEILFERSSHTVLLCVGDPANNDMRIYCNDATDSSGGGPNEWKAGFYEGIEHYVYCDEDSFCIAQSGKHDILIGIGEKGDRMDRSFYNGHWDHMKCCFSMARLIDYRSDFEYAKTFARQARFEHGETPTPNRRY
jgi:hypothetical protein